MSDDVVTVSAALRITNKTPKSQRKFSSGRNDSTSVVMIHENGTEKETNDVRNLNSEKQTVKTSIVLNNATDTNNTHDEFFQENNKSDVLVKRSPSVKSTVVLNEAVVLNEENLSTNQDTMCSNTDKHSETNKLTNQDKAINNLDKHGIGQQGKSLINIKETNTALDNQVNCLTNRDHNNNMNIKSNNNNNEVFDDVVSSLIKPEMNIITSDKLTLITDNQQGFQQHDNKINCTDNNRTNNKDNETTDDSQCSLRLNEHGEKNINLCLGEVNQHEHTRHIDDVSSLNALKENDSSSLTSQMTAKEFQTTSSSREESLVVSTKIPKSDSKKPVKPKRAKHREQQGPVEMAFNDISNMESPPKRRDFVNDLQPEKAENHYQNLSSIESNEEIRRPEGELMTSYVAKSMESIYENGMMAAKLAESNENLAKQNSDMLIRTPIRLNDSFETSTGGDSRERTASELNKIVKVQYKPKKPKRILPLEKINSSTENLNMTSSSLNDVTITSLELQNALNAQVDSQNNVYIPKEQFDAFVEREKGKYSHVVSYDASFSFDEGPPSSPLLQTLEPVAYFGSTTQIAHHPPAVPDKTRKISLEGELDTVDHSNVLLERKISITSRKRVARSLSTHSKGSVKVQDVSAMLDSQLGQLEEFLIKHSPSPSTENLMDITPDSSDEPFSKNTWYPPNEHVGIILPPERHASLLDKSHATTANGFAMRSELPDIPEHNTDTDFRSRVKSIRKSIRKARKRVITKSGRTITLPGLERSFQLPKAPKRFSRKNRDNKVILRNGGRRNIYGVEGDNRTSRMLGVEYEKMQRQLEVERRKIEEERVRLNELKRQAAEKAESDWNLKRQEVERREVEEKEIENRKEQLEELKKQQEIQAEKEKERLLLETEKMKKHEELLKQREKELQELHKERERREELEKLLQNEKENENVLERTLLEEKERLTTLERSFAEERTKRLEIERRLQEEEARNRLFSSDDKKRPLDTRSNGAPSQNGTLKRRVPSYTLSLRSGQSSGNEEINLLHHVLAAGHIVDNCPAIKINRYSARGYLLKMGKSRLKTSWQKRWFVFDRKLRALCYYQDERKTKSKGILYFQSIQEVYVDSSIKRSPNTRTTFCVRTPQRTFVLCAPSAIAMSIWLDVICTGKEGAFSTMTL